MTPLFLRMLSNGLQALVPAATVAAWFGAGGQRHRARATGLGLALGLALTWPIASLFVSSIRQGQWEAILAATMTVTALWVVVAPRAVPSIALGAIVALAVVRQAMIPASILRTTLQLPSSHDTFGVLAALVAAAAIAAIWWRFALALPEGARRTATLTFAVLFLAQAAYYTIHRSAELGWLPAAHTLEAATEPYGPDGLYGPWISIVIVAAGFLAGGVSGWRRGASARSIVVACGALIAIPAICVVAVRTPPPAGAAAPPAADPAGTAAEIADVTSTPHVLFRSSHLDATYGRLAITSLSSPGQRIVASGLGCDRVAFAGSAGICLHANRGVTTTFEAILFDAGFRPTRSIPLPGEPSRARVSSDGRFGAFTVFIAGHPHGYTMTGFSTATVLLDMASGAQLGNLESFSTVRDGRPFKAADFNFWGVTFARDSNTFYATLQTGGVIFLVRGDVARRTLTVLREGVECPSLSPDGTRLAFKQRVSSSPVQWRLRVMDLATLTDRPIAGESRSVDDQLEWLDPSHVLYGLERRGQPVRDVWVASVDTADPARVFLAEAESPVVIGR